MSEEVSTSTKQQTKEKCCGCLQGNCRQGICLVSLVLCLGACVVFIIIAIKHFSWSQNGHLLPCAQTYTCAKPFVIEDREVKYYGGDKLDGMLVARKPTKKAPRDFKYDFSGQSTPTGNDGMPLLFSFYLSKGSTVEWTILSPTHKYRFQLLRADIQVPECDKKTKEMPIVGKQDACWYYRNEVHSGAFAEKFRAQHDGKYRIVLRPKDTSSVLFKKIEFRVHYDKYDLTDNIIETKKGQYTFTLSSSGEGECVFVDHKCDAKLQLVQGSLLSQSAAYDDPETNFSLSSTLRRTPLKWIGITLAIVFFILCIVILVMEPEVREKVMEKGNEILSSKISQLL